MMLDLPTLVNKYNIKIKGILHIGAHFGQENSLYNHLGIKNRIFFEPLKSNYQILKNNIGEEHLSLNIALGNENKKVLMNVETANEGQSSSILKPFLHLTQYPNIKFETTEEVEMKKLDSLDINLSNFNTINIDVQGYELEVFKGAKQTLKHIDYIIAEINRDEVYQDCARIEQLIDFLSPYGFELVEQEWWNGGIWGDGLFIKKNPPLKTNKGISLICACKNRLSALKISLASWLEHKEIQEIIIVDWSSDQPVHDNITLDPRIKIVRVEDQTYFNQPQPLNLALKLCTYDTIIKVDCDYIFNTYEGFNFFEKYSIDNYCFVCGDTEETNPPADPYFRYLRGLLYIKKKFLEEIGGWNENFKEYYGGEEWEIESRLTKYGLEKKKIKLDYTLIHIPHSSKERIANFEGHNLLEPKEKLKAILIDNYLACNPMSNIPLNEAEWSWETNTKSLSELSSAYNILKNSIKGHYNSFLTKWNISQITSQLFTANII